MQEDAQIVLGQIFSRVGINHDSSIVTLDSLLLDKVKGKSSYFFDGLEMAFVMSHY